MSCQSFGQPLRRVVVSHLSHRQSLKSDDGVIHDADVGLGSTRLLILPGIAQPLLVSSVARARGRILQPRERVKACRRAAIHSPIYAGLKETGLFQQLLQARQRTRRSVERCQKCVPLNGIQIKSAPMSQRIASTR